MAINSTEIIGDRHGAQVTRQRELTSLDEQVLDVLKYLAKLQHLQLMVLAQALGSNIEIPGEYE